MAKIAEIAWLAGILEGEGSFINACRGSPRVSLSMTDEDVVNMAVAIAGGKYVGTRRFTNHYKTQFILQICGHRAAALMMTIYPFMGMRRKAKIKEILTQWKQSLYRRQIAPSIFCGHIERKHYAKNMCQSCYRNEKRRNLQKSLSIAA